MTSLKIKEIFAQLDDVLEHEREALITGNLEALTDLLEKKERLFDMFEQVSFDDRGHLEALHEKVTRNQALLDSALQGIKAVSERMATLRRVRRSLETYDQTGRRTEILNNSHHKVEKRA